MKKVGRFLLLMVIAVIILPLFIVKGCYFWKKDTPAPAPNTRNSEIILKVFNTAEKATIDVPIEEYLKNVVAAEMPAEFDIEALKAQAIAARTYAFSRYLQLYVPDDKVHAGDDVCTDYAHCQAWKSKEDAMKDWGAASGSKYWSKIEEAVNDTKGIIITYNNTIIDPLFHSCSGGKTENASEIWGGGDVPYLRSVISKGEENSPEFKTEVSIKEKDFTDKLKSRYPNIKFSEKDILKDIKILDYTTGGRVKNLKIGSITLSGTDFRSLFELKSTMLTFERNSDGSIRITAQGNGHGAGMSQWGANYMAKSGEGYEAILKHYYTGVELSTIDKYIQ